MFNIGILGHGRWGQILARNVLSHPLLQLRYISDPGVSASLEFLNVNFIKDEAFWQLTSSDLDGVMIASPPELHVAQAKKCLDRNWSVYIEKPISTSVYEVSELLNHMKRTSSSGMVGYLHRLSPAFLKIKSLINRAVVHESLHITKIRSIGSGNGPFRQSYSSLWDYGPHDLSMLLDLVPGEWMVTNSVKEKAANGGEIYDFSLLHQNHSIEAHITVGSGSLEKKRFFEVTLSNGSTYAYDDQSTQKIRVVNPMGFIEYPEVSSALALTESIKRYVEVMAKKEFDDSIFLSAELTKIINHVDQSVRIL